MIELIPRRKVDRLSKVFEFLTFFFSSSSLKILAFSTKVEEVKVSTKVWLELLMKFYLRVVASPVSLHLALNRSM